MLRYKDLALIVVKNGEEVGKAPIEDMSVLVLDGPDLLLTHQLLAACADAGVAVITADEKHMPNGLLLPFAGHSLTSATLRAQIGANLPAQKRAWQSVVKAKIRAQADAVARSGGDDGPLGKLVPLVRSGDPDNIEARAAGRYFGALFGSNFARDREQPGVNAHLNYGYAVVRSCVARALVGAGLHPSLGIHHRNQYNSFCLADDAMEPFRPLVDYRVWQMASRGEVSDELTPAAKRSLVQVVGGSARIDGLKYPLLVALERYAASMRRAICDGEALAVPAPVLE